MAQLFRSGDRVCIRDTPRVRNACQHMIAQIYIIGQSQADDLNNEFPADIADFSFLPADLRNEGQHSTNTGGYSTTIAEDPDVAEAKRMAGSPGTHDKPSAESDLDQMEQQMGKYRKPPPDSIWDEPKKQEVTDMRNLLKSPAQSALVNRGDDYDVDKGITPILIVRSKKKRRELMIGTLPSVLMPSLRR